MPFEPLKTDEKLEKPIKSKADMDSLMLVGCGAFIASAFITYGLGIWPFLVISQSHILRILLIDLAVAAVPSIAFGVFMSRKYTLPGACGYIGGSMSISVFIYIRLKQILSMVGSSALPQADYPQSWATIIPLFWLGVAILVVLVSLPKKTFD